MNRIGQRIGRTLVIRASHCLLVFMGVIITSVREKEEEGIYSV